jgi:hypothetical protein
MMAATFRAVRLSRPGTWLVIPRTGPWWIGTTDDFGTLVPISL